MKKSTKKGFTLVELVIVIAVIAILAAVLIPTFSGVIERANISADLQALTASIESKYVEYVADNHDVPAGVKVDANENVEFANATEATKVAVIVAGKNGYKFVLTVTADGTYVVTSLDTKTAVTDLKKKVYIGNDAVTVEGETGTVSNVNADAFVEGLVVNVTYTSTPVAPATGDPTTVKGKYTVDTVATTGVALKVAA